MESLLLVLVLSLDSFVASIAFGANKIRVSGLSILIINTVCTVFLAVSILFGSIARNIFPGNVASILSFSILVLLGIYYLFENMVKSYLKVKVEEQEKIKIKMFGVWLIIELYVDETKADFDFSKTLDYKEALYLATALSLDSLAVGFGSSLGSINYLSVLILSLVVGILAVWLGLFIGKKVNDKVSINLSWLSGAILIILGVLKLF